MENPFEEQLSPAAIAVFTQTVWDYFESSGRDLPWRIPDDDGHFDPYKILVSEIMLQQTQVTRVIAKFTAFLQRFPTVQTLAKASLADVLIIWNGLGYNRRAKFLWQAAQVISSEHKGTVPHTMSALTALPGVGDNTAGAIVAYAYNQPVVFIETNIRTVYIHHFFADIDQVPDSAVRKCVAQTLDRERPRQWYWALMDYGTYLKATAGNASQRSQHFVKQSQFAGSRRYIRGQILRLLAQSSCTFAELKTAIPDDRLQGVLNDLQAEQLIQRTADTYRL